MMKVTTFVLDVRRLLKQNSPMKNSSKLKEYCIWFGKSFLWLMPVLLAFDIWSKLGVEVFLFQQGKVLTLIPNFFYIRVAHNTGAAWSFGSGYTVLLAWVSLVAAVLLIAFLTWKFKKLNWWYRIALYLIITGCVGNLIDRAFSVMAPTSLYGNGVIDFLDFHFGNYVFPTFNLADSYLVIGCIVLIIGLIVTEAVSNKKNKEDNIEAEVLSSAQNESASNTDLSSQKETRNDEVIIPAPVEEIKEETSQDEKSEDNKDEQTSIENNEEQAPNEEKVSKPILEEKSEESKSVEEPVKEETQTVKENNKKPKAKSKPKTSSKKEPVKREVVVIKTTKPKTKSSKKGKTK